MSHPRAALARRPRLIHAALVGLSVAAGAASCELVNAFPDALVPDAGKGGGASVSSSSSSASSSSSSSSGTGGGSDAGVRGIVAVAGRVVEAGVKTSTRVFAVLDAETGAELSRYDDLSIVAAIHDPATDLWYLFEAATLPPLNTSPITLHVGTIDPADGRWVEGSSVTNVPVVADAIDVGVLNDRLVYAAFDPTYDAGGVPPIGLAVVDTSAAPASLAPAAFGGYVSLADVGPDASAVTFNGFISTPSSPGQGGHVNLVTETCASTCVLTRYLLSLAEDPSIAPTPNADETTTIPRAANGISAAWGSLLGQYDVVVYPPPPPVDGGAPGMAVVQAYNPVVPTQAGAPLAQFILNEVAGGEQFTGLAYDPCLSVLLLAERNAEDLYAVTLPMPWKPGSPTDASVTQLPINQTTNILYFDPVTSNIFMPLQPANSTFALEAWHLGGTSTSPTLTQLTTTWSPPADLAIDVVAVRQPPSFICPGGG